MKPAICPPANQGWYVIRTKPQAERLAAEALNRNGFEMFFPCVRVPGNTSRPASAPLFPGYLFLRNDEERKDWPSVSRLPGVLGLVHFNGVAPLVSDDVIEDLALRVDAINERGGLWAQLQAGDKVRVVSGKMETLAEVVEEPKSPQARVRVLLEFMGRRVSAQVPFRDLQLAKHSVAYSENPKGVRRTRGRGRWIRGFGPGAASA